MKNSIIKAMTICAATSLFVFTPSFAQNSMPTVEASKPFVKKRYSIKGEWSVAEVDGETQIRFSDDFKTKGGPDLKVFLSKTSIENLDSETAEQNSFKIGVLKSKSGGQIYTLPDDINLSNYKSVIIHCSAFSVLWGGFDLPANQTAIP